MNLLPGQLTDRKLIDGVAQTLNNHNGFVYSASQGGYKSIDDKVIFYTNCKLYDGSLLPLSEEARISSQKWIKIIIDIINAVAQGRTYAGKFQIS